MICLFLHYQQYKGINSDLHKILKDCIIVYIIAWIIVLENILWSSNDRNAVGRKPFKLSHVLTS